MRVLVLAALPLALAACATSDTAADAAPPDDVAGTYALVAINGQDLPVYVGSYEGCDEYAAEGTLELSADGRYTFRSTMREDCAASSELESGTEQESELGTYTVDGRTVRLREEARERAALNRYEDDGGNTDGRDIPVEDLGGTGRVEGDRLTVGLKQTDDTVTFRRR